MTVSRLRRPAALAAALATALAAAPAALAHVDLEPIEAAPGQPVRLTFYAPNEGKAEADELQLDFPEGAVPAVAQAVTGWTATVRERTVTWSGGSIPVGTYGLFSAVVEAPDASGPIEVRTTLRYVDGTRQVFSPVLFVREPRAAQATDGSSRTLATYALGLAAAALALAGGAGLLGLWAWLRAGDPPGPPAAPPAA